MEKSGGKIRFKGRGRALEYCGWCVHDLGSGCDILNRALLYEPDDERFPAQWVADDLEGTNARCEAFFPASKGDLKKAGR